MWHGWYADFVCDRKLTFLSQNYDYYLNFDIFIDADVP